VTIWEVLGLPAGSDRAAIRRGYARKLRETHPEDDPEGFKQLRAAYEMALAYADQGVSAPEAEVATDVAFEPAPEIDALLAEREGDIAALNDLLAKLDAGLRGPWSGDDRGLVVAFEQVMKTRAMGEISVRDDVEHWIAALIAATIPRSDAILAQAARAFGWVQDRQSGQVPAVARAIERLDEWAVIENLSRDSHPLHPAWNTLTRPAGAYWSWRIDAFRPGMETGVETLLGERGPITPGLAHSFKADSVARWQAFLARTHLTLGMFAAIPLVLLVFLAMRAGLGKPVAAIEPYADWAAVLAILAPVAPFVARLLRRSWLAAARPVWAQEGWVAAIGMVFLAAALIPPVDRALWPLAGAAALTWAWMAVAGGAAELAEIQARLRNGWITALACLFAVPFGLVTMGGTRIAAMTIAAALALTVAAGPLRQGAEILARRVMVSVWIAVALAAGYAVIAFAASRLYVPPGFHKLFYPAALTLVFGALVASAARLTVMRSVAEVRIVRFLKVGLLVLFAAVALFATTEIKRLKRATTVPVATRWDDETVATQYGGPPLRERIAGALSVDPGTERAVTQLRQIPGFAQIAAGDPSLHARIVAIVGKRGNAPGADEAAADAIVALLTRTYVERLPLADEALLHEELRIRRARLLALRARSIDACLTPRTAFDEVALPEADRARQTAQGFNVITNPLAVPSLGRGAQPYSATELNAYLPDDSRLVSGEFPAALEGKDGPPALCNARIALTGALERHPTRSGSARRCCAASPKSRYPTIDV
jgi:hypothetical protein